MNRKGLRFALVFATVLCVVGLPSCARNQHLVSISVTPSSVVFEGVGSVAQFTAVGTYIHPAENKDITSQVVWKTDVPGLVSFSSTIPGQATALNVCGFGQVTASVYSNPSNPSRGSVVTGTADVAGVAQGSSTCTGTGGTGSGSPALAVDIVDTGTSTGTVTSSPLGITCPTTCVANFASGTTVTLTATLTGTSTSVTWSGCTPNALTCTISSLTTNTVVTATFN